MCCIAVRQAAQSVGETDGTPGDLSALMETLKGQDAPPPTFVKVLLLCRHTLPPYATCMIASPSTSICACNSLQAAAALERTSAATSQFHLPCSVAS